MPANRSKSSRPEQMDPAGEGTHDLESMKDSLRRAYENIKDERVPDKLQRLIDALREAEHMSKERDGD